MVGAGTHLLLLTVVDVVGQSCTVVRHSVLLVKEEQAVVRLYIDQRLGLDGNLCQREAGILQHHAGVAADLHLLGLVGHVRHGDVRVALGVGQHTVQVGHPDKLRLSRHHRGIGYAVALCVNHDDFLRLGAHSRHHGHDRNQYTPFHGLHFRKLPGVSSTYSKTRPKRRLTVSLIKAFHPLLPFSGALFMALMLTR